MDIEKLFTEGIIFKGSGERSDSSRGKKKVQTKAKKKSYVSSGRSGASQMRAEYRRKRANRK